MKYPLNTAPPLVRISPSSASFISIPWFGTPTVPSFIFLSLFPDAYPQFSVIPYPSKIGTPKAIKNFKISGAMGAAPEIAVSALLNPSFFFNVLKDKSQPIDIKKFAKTSLKPYLSFLSAPILPRYIEILNSCLLMNDASLILTIAPECILSKILGTAGKMVGCISAKSIWTVSIDSAKLIVAIVCDAINKSVNLPKIWHNGR